MLACIPTNGNAGLADTVSDHFGSAPYFTLVDSETGEVTVIENRDHHHRHGMCQPLAQLAGHNIDCVVCSGMGRRAVGGLKKAGIKVYNAGGENVGQVIDKIKSGELVEMSPADACRGHGSGAGHGHGRGQGCGHAGSGRAAGGQRQGQSRGQGGSGGGQGRGN
jgi:predicted Fe-Mo cluster-binding NifX family protein